MKRKLNRIFSRGPGSALVLTLVMIVLITVIIVGYIASVSLETKSARSALDGQKANNMAMLGLNSAMARLRDGLGPWDNALSNFTGASGAPPTFYWSISPGRLTRWSYSQVAPLANYSLFSDPSNVPNTAITTNLVNLNRQRSDGTYPIIGGANPPDVSVKWVNVLSNPSLPASGNNKVIGRYAFWVDDEGAKININTADGTAKNDYTKSLGAGTPTEVSLGVLPQGGASLYSSSSGTTVAQNIVQIARASGFHSIAEILRTSGATTDLYTNNVFNLTVLSRSPDFNVFGEPKMPLITSYCSSAGASQVTGVATTGTNAVTMKPMTEVYPTYSQLPTVFPAKASSEAINPIPWPTAFLQANYWSSVPYTYHFVNSTLYNGMLLANYLSGKNAAGVAVTWPAFPGSAASGFLGKYSARQIDSIVAQIMDFTMKDTTLDAMGNTSFGSSVHSTPSGFPGWLSGQLVSGIGRSPKVAQILVTFQTIGSTTVSGIYNPPKALIYPYVEWWFPAGYQGVTLYHNESQNVGFGFAPSGQTGMLNSVDAPATLSPTPTAARLVNSDGTPNRWSNNLWRNNQGIDFVGNTSTAPDPDQTLAQLYHPYQFSTTFNQYMGAGSATPDAPILRINGLIKGVTRVDEWSPGEYRCFGSQYLNKGFRSPMQPSADGNNLIMDGGLAILSQMRTPSYSEADPVPLEAIRGNLLDSAGANSVNAGGVAEDITSGTVRARVLAAVIPLKVSVPVPAGNDVATVNNGWVYARVSDPLVNKFPADWIVTTGTNSALPATGLQLPTTATTWTSYLEDSTRRGRLTDPDSFWSPTIDSFLSQGDAPIMPRSARFPSIGFLQYLRTGIIPDNDDDPAVDFSLKHGTPYRLLSFAPSTESLNQTTTRDGGQSYPDWAMLDLVNMPSTLGIQYGTFGGATSGRINPNGSVIYTTDVNTPAKDSNGNLISRTLPLQAVLHDLKVNQTLKFPTAVAATVTPASWTGSQWDSSSGTTVDDVGIAAAIQDYIKNNGPFRLPGEICNVPAIAALRPSNNATRNDLVRQIIGNLTTQSNVFSVWVAGQTIQKIPSHTQYGQYETGDAINGESRMHFIVERYLDPGADGVYGNSVNPGSDGIVGTLDDPIDPANHPFTPKYLYRIVSAEEIR